MRTLLFIVVVISTLATMQMCMFAKTANYYKDTINERVYKTNNSIADAVLNAQEVLRYLEQHN